MCTASWLRIDDGYRLFFNRDELRRRQPAAAPTIRERGGVRWIAPADGDSGGSWIAANEFGVTLFLLNGYAPADGTAPGAGWTSRGALVDDLADARSVTDVARRLGEQRLASFRSFSLAALGPAPGREDPGILGTWVGGTLTVEALPLSAMPLVSSSFDTSAVRQGRIASFANAVASGSTVDDHLAYHASHDPEAGPYSVCMHRPDAHTVSFSHIAVDGSAVLFYYAPHAPHDGLPTHPTATLARRQ